MLLSTLSLLYRGKFQLASFASLEKLVAYIIGLAYDLWQALKIDH